MGVLVCWRPLLTGIVFIAAISLFFTIFLPYYGEDGRYTLASLEMYYDHYYWQPTNYGGYYGRPPLFNWLTIPIMHIIGPRQVLVATRIAAASASVLIGAMLWFLTLRLFGNRLFAIFTVAAFFSGDFLFRRGWIASPDTWFSLGTFTAICFMWLSIKDQRSLYWIPVPIALFGAVLAKALTAYVFYGTALIVIWVACENRSYVFKPASIFAHLAAVALPVIWFTLLPNSQWHAILRDVSERTMGHAFNWSHYFIKITLSPIDIIIRSGPVTFLALYCLYRQKKPAQPSTLPALNHKPIQLMVWILILSILPYWLSPSFLAFRYLIPVLPLMAIVFSWCIWRAGEKMVSITILVLIFELAFKCVSSFIGLPWFEGMDYPQQQIANDIIQRTKNTVLYAEVGNGFGANMVSLINTTLWPKAPIMWAPPSLTQGCVMVNVNTPEWQQWGKLEQTYKIYTHKYFYIYLYCRN